MKFFNEIFLEKISKKTVITREDEVPYLIRYTVFNFWIISMKFHHILLSDDHCMHDHPWMFISFMLKGSYYEITPRFEFTDTTKSYFNDQVKVNYFKKGDILIRPAKWIHRLELPNGEDTWTLVFTFRKVRAWGFFTKYGWFHWQHYKAKQHCE